MPRSTTDGERESRDLELFEMPDAGRLIEEHKALVLKLARRHARFGLGAEDLVSEGELGLLRAAKKFNPKLGVKFSTYAIYWVRQAMLRALDNKSRTVRLPWQSKAKLRRLKEAKSAFLREHGHEASEAEMAKVSGLSLRTLRTLRNSCSEGVSLDATNDAGGHGQKHSLLDAIPDPSASPYEALAGKDSRELFLRALSTLDRREAKIIKLRFGLCRSEGVAETCESIGSRIGISREGVRKIQERSILKLRAMLLTEFQGAGQDAIAV